MVVSEQKVSPGSTTNDHGHRTASSVSRYAWVWVWAGAGAGRVMGAQTECN